MLLVPTYLPQNKSKPITRNTGHVVWRTVWFDVSFNPNLWKEIYLISTVEVRLIMSALVRIDWKVIILFLVLIIRVRAWDNDDLEVFDVVEDVEQNFYELLGVAQVCTYYDTFEHMGSFVDILNVIFYL